MNTIMTNQKLNLTKHLLTSLPWPAKSTESPANQPLHLHPAWRQFLDLLHERLSVPNPAWTETFLELLDIADTM